MTRLGWAAVAEIWTAVALTFLDLRLGKRKTLAGAVLVLYGCCLSYCRVGIVKGKGMGVGWNCYCCRYVLYCCGFGFMGMVGMEKNWARGN